MNFGLKVGKQIKDMMYKKQGWDIDDEEELEIPQESNTSMVAALQQVYDMQLILNIERQEQVEEIKLMKSRAQNEIQQQREQLEQEQLSNNKCLDEIREQRRQLHHLFKLSEQIDINDTQEQIINKLIVENNRLNEDIKDVQDMQHSQMMEYEDKLEIAQNDNYKLITENNNQKHKVQRILSGIIQEIQGYRELAFRMENRTCDLLNQQETWTQKQILIIQQQYMTITDELQYQIKQLQQQQQESDEQFNELQEESNSYVKLIKQLRKSEDQLFEENEQLQQQINTQYAELEQYKRINHRLQENIEGLQQNLTQSRYNLGLEQQIEQLKEDKMELKLEIESKNVQIEGLLQQGDPWGLDNDDPWKQGEPQVDKTDELNHQLQKQKEYYEQLINETNEKWQNILTEYKQQLHQSLSKEHDKEQQMHQLQICLVDQEYQANYQNTLLQMQIEQLSINKPVQIEEEKAILDQQFQQQQSQQGVEYPIVFENDDNAWQIDSSVEDQDLIEYKNYSSDGGDKPLLEQHDDWADDPNEIFIKDQQDDYENDYKIETPCVYQVQVEPDEENYHIEQDNNIIEQDNNNIEQVQDNNIEIEEQPIVEDNKLTAEEQAEKDQTALDNYIYIQKLLAQHVEEQEAEELIHEQLKQQYSLSLQQNSVQQLTDSYFHDQPQDIKYMSQQAILSCPQGVYFKKSLNKSSQNGEQQNESPLEQQEEYVEQQNVEQKSEDEQGKQGNYGWIQDDEQFNEQQQTPLGQQDNQENYYEKEQEMVDEDQQIVDEDQQMVDEDKQIGQQQHEHKLEQQIDVAELQVYADEQIVDEQPQEHSPVYEVDVPVEQDNKEEQEQIVEVQQVHQPEQFIDEEQIDVAEQCVDEPQDQGIQQDEPQPINQQPDVEFQEDLEDMDPWNEQPAEDDHINSDLDDIDPWAGKQTSPGWDINDDDQYV